MLHPFIDHIKNSILDQSFVKLSLSSYHGTEEQLKNLYLKKIIIKSEVKYSITYRYQTKDIVKNYGQDEALFFIEKYLEPHGFHHANLFSLNADYVLEYTKGAEWKLKKLNPSFKTPPSTEHDKPKFRLIDSKGKPYLHDLQITDANGKVLAHAQDKYKQINHYIDILSSLLQDLPSDKDIKIVDMGSGKGYLTFALYDYLINKLKIKAEVRGIEQRKELVDFCNEVAKKSKFDYLRFEVGQISQFDIPNHAVLIALHACDTATDDAIEKAITAKADLIVVAPCCHKQIRKEIEKSKSKNDLDDVIRHGIFLERQAEMVTDSIRALILEYHGYAVKVFEFISDAHTPKNIMITAQKKSKSTADRTLILQKIKKLKSIYGIESHYLEKILKL